jgi:hypothetical protein
MKAVVVNAMLEQRMRAWLAATLGASATWRNGKAVEYRDDPRNSNSAVALASAATYVRLKHGAGIYQMTELVAACEEIEFELVTYPGPRSERVAGRYGFDTPRPPLDDASHDKLLRDIFVASLEDLREELEGDIPPESRLAQLIEKHLPQLPPSPEQTTIALLTEIRGLLSDRLPVAETKERLSAELSTIADLLVEIADSARHEEGPDGRLPQLQQPTRLPLLRRRLAIALAIARALGAQNLEACRKLVEEPPVFATQTVSGVLSAVEEVQRAVETEMI